MTAHEPLSIVRTVPLKNRPLNVMDDFIMVLPLEQEEDASE